MICFITFQVHDQKFRRRSNAYSWRHWKRWWNLLKMILYIFILYHQDFKKDQFFVSAHKGYITRNSYDVGKWLNINCKLSEEIFDIRYFHEICKKSSEISPKPTFIFPRNTMQVFCILMSLNLFIHKKCLHHHAELKLYTVGELEILRRASFAAFQNFDNDDDKNCFVYLNEL